MGGSLFGPAGTGKTESMKELSVALGRCVLLFDCDEAFSISAMGRLLAGLDCLKLLLGAALTSLTAWNVEERVLSTVSQQIL